MALSPAGRVAGGRPHRSERGSSRVILPHRPAPTGPARSDCSSSPAADGWTHSGRAEIPSTLRNTPAHQAPGLRASRENWAGRRPLHTSPMAAEDPPPPSATASVVDRGPGPPRWWSRTKPANGSEVSQARSAARSTRAPGRAAYRTGAMLGRAVARRATPLRAPPTWG